MNLLQALIFSPLFSWLAVRYSLTGWASASWRRIPQRDSAVCPEDTTPHAGRPRGFRSLPPLNLTSLPQASTTSRRQEGPWLWAPDVWVSGRQPHKAFWWYYSTPVAQPREIHLLSQKSYGKEIIFHNKRFLSSFSSASNQNKIILLLYVINLRLVRMRPKV